MTDLPSAAAARAFAAGSRWGAAGGRAGRLATAARVGREAYRTAGAMSGDPRAIIAAAMNCDSPGEAMAAFAKSWRRE
jgi:hypothetical protein